jgi:hypothetical protein
MIWASILATDESENRKERFKVIKKLLIKRYGRPWWENVYARVKPAYAAKQRLIKNLSGGMVEEFIFRTTMGEACAADEVHRALDMIPKV